MALEINFRIATWNLDHASNSGRPKVEQVHKICEINPHLVVLTETCRDVDLTHLGYVGQWSTPNKYGKQYSAIWTRWPILERVTTCSPELATCAIVTTPFGILAVYGTIFTYRNYKGVRGHLGPWEAHLKDIAVQGDDWQRIRASRNNCPLVVAGDFNQARDGMGVYKSRRAIEALDNELQRNDLVCATQENFGAVGKLTVDPRLGRYRHNIDHICLPKAGFRVNRVDAWDGFLLGTDPLVRLSDHNGVYIDVATTGLQSAS